MSISRGSVLTGHVLGSMVQAAISIAVLLAVAVLLGFRPSAGPVEWLGVIGLLAIASFALIWLAVALGMVTNSVETASNLPMPTDSMPGPLKLFAEYQPVGTRVDVLVEGEAGGRWTLPREADRWHLVPADERGAAACARMPQDIAWKLLSRTIAVSEALPEIAIEGDERLGRLATKAVAIMTTQA